MDKYVFREYDPQYKKYFLQEKESLIDILSDKVTIEHIGSTAVPGLGGKGIVDVAVGVLSQDNIEATKEKLEDAGYEFCPRASTPERLFIRRNNSAGQQKRIIHLHLMMLDGSEWRQLIIFRDHLRNNLVAATKYAAVKKKAVEIANGEGEKYRQHKERFIVRILEKIK